MESPMMFSVREGSIGPAHDPYGTTLLTGRRGGAKRIEWYYDGLGQCRVTLFQAAVKVREIRWHYTDRVCQLKAEILFRLTTGVSVDAAMEKAHEVNAAMAANHPAWMREWM